MADEDEDLIPGLGVASPEDPPDWSDEGLAELERDDQIRLMLEWFNWNFEDPAQSTPYESREGGYQYIWGGPYEALDQLQDRFGGRVPDEVIDEAVKETEWTGWEWAPHERRIRPEDEIYSPPSSSPGTPSPERFFKEVVNKRLHDVESALTKLDNTLAPIGHNQPPEAIEEIPLPPTVLVQLREAVHESQSEGHSSTPDVTALATRAQFFKATASEVLKWLAKKADVALDEMAKSFGSLAGKLMAAGIPIALGEVYLELSSKLGAAAEALLQWVKLIAG